ncbi:MAG: hypothetical protein R8G66_06685 [Cytophagales bacterium]|nr:hypothetical protein [Cytophagales bacterium]
MTKTYFSFTLLFCALCFISCSEEEEIVPLALEPLPEGSVAFLNISVGDESYNLIDGVDNSIFSSSLLAPATSDAQFSKEFGASVTSDTSVLTFRIAYSREANNRDETLIEITQGEGQYAFGEVIDLEKIERRKGFNIEIVEDEYVGGPGQGYASWYFDQPETSFFTITEYYAGESELTVWLKGEFKATILNTSGASQVRGDFLMEFPVCCFD